MTIRYILIFAAAGAVMAVAAIAIAMHLFYARFYGFQQEASAPEAEGLPGVAVASFASEDGREIRAWVAQPRDGLPTVVYFPGGYSSVGPSAQRMRPFLEAGYGLAVLEYRGSSGSNETPSEENFARDARALYDHLDALLGIAVPPERRALYGFSLGSAVATRLAAERPVGAVVLEATFPRVCEHFELRYRGAPLCLLMWKDRYEPAQRIGEVAVPKLFLHGARDTEIPIDWARRLYDAAPEPKAFVAYPKGAHSDLLAQGSARDALAFFAEVLSGAPPAAGRPSVRGRSRPPRGWARR